MWIGFTAKPPLLRGPRPSDAGTRRALPEPRPQQQRLNHRALVFGREVGLLRAGALAVALHLHDPALALHRLLPDHCPDEDQDERDAEEGGAEVDRGAEQGAADQQHEDDDGYRHGGGIVGAGRTRRFYDSRGVSVSPPMFAASAAAAASESCTDGSSVEVSGTT